MLVENVSSVLILRDYIVHVFKKYLCEKFQAGYVKKKHTESIMAQGLHNVLPVTCQRCFLKGTFVFLCKCLVCGG